MDAGTDETSSTSCSPDVGGSAEGPLAAPIMASALTVLFLNLRYPKPSISLSPSGDVALGGAVTVQCRGRHQIMRFLLYQDGNPNVLQDAEPAGDLAEFPIRDVSQRDAGSYSCYHHDKVYPFTWSHPSDPVELVVAGELPGSVSPVPAPHPAGPSGAGACARGQADTVPHSGLGGAWHRGGGDSAEGPLAAPIMASAPMIIFLGCWLAGQSRVSGQTTYSKPSISLHPSREVTPGEAVTVRCQAPYQNMRFLLYKDGNRTALQEVELAGNVAEFPIRNVSRRDAGSYHCRYSNKTDASASSHPSDPVELVVAERSYPKPNIYLRPGGGVSLGGAVTVWCRGQHRGVRFVLNKEGRHFPSVDSDGFEVVFPISNVSREDGGSYSCSYHSGSEPFAVSYPSNPVKVLVRGGTDLGHPGAAPAPTHPPGSPGPGGSESPASLGLTSSIITRASAAAAGFLLLLVAFVCFRKTRARKGAAPRPSSTSPLRVLKTPTMQDPVYTSMDEGKETQTLEPDPDGLTYAELDGQALQAKWGGPTPAPAPEPAQPSVYAVINVSRGAPQ
nr:leukocyte immunoglobulin-like receptor subfamily B member 1 [Chrysemys picta bellii]